MTSSATLAHLTLDERVRLQHEVEQFLFYEAHLLDERKFEEWLELLAEDVHYWMPIRRTTAAKDSAIEFTKPGDMAFFDDDHRTLAMRVKRLTVGRAWAEDPESRTRHFITNVRLLGVEGDEVQLSANLLLYRARLNSDLDHWTGRREDTLRRVGDSFELVRRHVYLEQTLILAQNMSNFF